MRSIGVLDTALTLQSLTVTGATQELTGVLETFAEVSDVLFALGRTLFKDTDENVLN